MDERKDTLADMNGGLRKEDWRISIILWTYECLFVRLYVCQFAYKNYDGLQQGQVGAPSGL